MNRKGSHHIRWEHRVIIEAMLRVNESKEKIAKAIGVSRKAVYDELKRGACVLQVNECDFVVGYSPETAERKYQRNLRAKGPELKIGSDHEFAAYIEDKIIREKYSPAAVLADIKKRNLFQTRICVNTLYNYIYSGDVFYELSEKHLLYQGKRHYFSQQRKQAAHASVGTSIDMRPAEVDYRTSFGHWELDSVMGNLDSKRAILVFTERLSRAPLLVPVPDHTAFSTVRALNRIERRLGKNFYKVFKTITVDNGSEFADVYGMEKSARKRGKRTKFYYCHPYSPHERGSNENMNRMIRQWFPKGTNFDNVSDEEVWRVQEWLDNYPRKILGWKSSREVREEYLNTA